MFDKFISEVAEVFADLIVDTGGLIGGAHQASREKLADYDVKAMTREVVRDLASKTVSATRNRYRERLGHGRLGHESLCAELRAADVSLQEALVRLTASPSHQNQAIAVAAAIRVEAITHTLGPACIAEPKAKRRSQRSSKVGGDRRMNRRALTVEDMPTEAHPHVARLAHADPDRMDALAALSAMRVSPLDQTGTITKLVTLAGNIQYREFVDTLAARARGEAAPESVEQSMEVPSQRPSAENVEPSVDPSVHASAVLPVEPCAPALASDIALVHPAPATPSGVIELTTCDEADIRKVESFCGRYCWSIKVDGGVLSLTTLTQRPDVNQAFDRVRDLAVMQSKLRAILDRSADNLQGGQA